MKNKYILLLLIFTAIFSNLNAQQEPDTDKMLSEAIAARQAQDYPKAVKIAEEALSYAPDYLDFRMLLGRIYNQTNRPDLAIVQFKIAEQSPDYQKNARGGLGISYELKKDRQMAIETYKKLHEQYPDEAIYLQKIKTLEENSAAVKYPAEVLTAGKKAPQTRVAARLSDELSTDTLKQNRVGILYMPAFRKNNSFHIFSLEYLRKTADKKNTLIARINYGLRNSEDGIQFEAEDYWVHGEKNYSFFNAAYSASEIFPEFRAGYSLYTAFPKGWELETGARYIHADDNNIYTLVVGASKEYEKNWFSLKNYITEDRKEYYPSHVLTWRHFLNEKRDFVSLILGLGTSPDLKNYQFSFNGYKDKSVGLGYQKKLSSHFLGSATAVYNRLLVGNHRDINRFDLYLNLYYQF
ncbi:YaiO family outer membrane beta-barrel protein [Chryseobacterium sp.]|uniref:YaiO family outer membrane beta-barrel protein n=1 Tax=Chryseobacterium sp. TaxID=1871047 RepID=UPI0011CA8D7B|nr:YaiO family outer membrane beta-barrel protein [Chryseobacterium sp.]TXF79558.1 YaiO family outer membrane beta-barrel protein [Chryseobacterium sp.]